MPAGQDFRVSWGAVPVPLGLRGTTVPVSFNGVGEVARLRAEILRLGGGAGG